jgi:hypothetical protein
LKDANRKLTPRAYKVFSHLILGRLMLNYGDARASALEIAASCGMSRRDVFRQLKALDAARMIVRKSVRDPATGLNSLNSFSFPTLLHRFNEISEGILPVRLVTSDSAVTRGGDGTVTRVVTASSPYDSPESSSHPGTYQQPCADAAANATATANDDEPYEPTQGERDYQRYLQKRRAAGMAKREANRRAKLKTERKP